MIQFYSTQITAHVERIFMPGGVAAYLVRGTEKAALIDCGFGCGDLHSYVQQRVNTPCVLLLTHGHMDHAGGASQFSSAYLHPQDWELATRHCEIQSRVFDLEHGRHGLPAGYVREDFLPSRTQAYQPLMEGQVFALGGITLQVMETPGHTTGSVVFLALEDRVLLAGDTCNENTLLIFPESTSVETYQNTLQKLWLKKDLFDLVLTNHGTYEADKKIVADMMDLCDAVLQGRDAAVKKKFRNFEGWQARPDLHPGKEGNLVYRIKTND